MRKKKWGFQRNFPYGNHSIWSPKANQIMNNQILINIVQKVVKEVLASQPCYSAKVEAQCVGMEVPVELSARHVHLSEADAITLFGAPLTMARELSQPGQFLCNERVRLIGPKGVMDNVAVLGPSRSASQVEISKTDARVLGVDAPVRQSGDTVKSPGIVLSSQMNIVGLEEGAIVAARHIHMSPQDAQEYGLVDNDIVQVRLNTNRPVILEDVRVRVNPTFKLAMHIDSDEGNSAGWSSKVTGTILGKK